jgi:hypothetical protein
MCDIQIDSSSGITIRICRRKSGIFAVAVAIHQPDKRGIFPGIFRLGRRRPLCRSVAPCSQSPTVARSLGNFLNHSADALRPGSSHVQLTGATGPNTSIHGHLSSPGVLLPPPAPSCDFSTASDPRAILLIHCTSIHHRMRPPSRLRQVLGHITPISATGMSAGEHPHSNLLSRSRWTQI